MRVSRGRYVSAGYAEKRTRPAADERELHISADPAGCRKGKPARFEQDGLPQ